MKKQSPNTTIDQRRVQWLKGVLDLCVLARLASGEAYGYEISKDLEAAGFGEIKGGTLYPLLNRLDRDGLVTTSWRAGDQGPNRKYYQITEVGLTTLRAAAEAWSEFTEIASQTLSDQAKEPT